MYHALNLNHTPDKWKTHSVTLELEAHNTAPNSPSKPYLFTMKSVVAITHNYVLKFAKGMGEEQGVRDMMDQLNRNIRERTNGFTMGTCMVIACEGLFIIAPHSWDDGMRNMLPDCDDWRAQMDLMLRVRIFTLYMAETHQSRCSMQMPDPASTDPELAMKHCQKQLEDWGNVSSVPD
jgi:hypothetical protein